jgi:hypothetical protein
MFYGFIERLRGIDKWPFASAAVTSVEQLSYGGRGGAWRRIIFTFNDGQTDIGGELKVDSNTSTDELAPGDTFDLQFNPKRSSSIYCEEAQSAFRTFGRAITFVWLVFMLTVILLHVFKR